MTPSTTTTLKKLQDGNRSRAAIDVADDDCPEDAARRELITLTLTLPTLKALTMAMMRSLKTPAASVLKLCLQCIDALQDCKKINHSKRIHGREPHR